MKYDILYVTQRQIKYNVIRFEVYNLFLSSAFFKYYNRVQSFKRQ